MKQGKWVQKFKHWIEEDPVSPGIYRHRDGGYLIRASATDTRTGKLKPIEKRLPEATQDEAEAWLVTRKQVIRQGSAPAPTAETPRLKEYGFYLLEKKVATGEINSAKTVEKWRYVLDRHLVPEWGDYYMDAFTWEALDEWRTAWGVRVKEDKAKPLSFNTVRGVLKVILETYYRNRKLTGCPIADIPPLSTKGHRTYTKEQPNQLTPDELRGFLTIIRQRHPQHFCMTAWGFALGQRPSTLRPLRRRGPHADVNWKTGEVEIRRSVAAGEVMDMTKNGEDQTITIPLELLEIARWHISTQLISEEMQKSDLLFPSTIGGYRSPSVLDKPFDEAARLIGTHKNITPRAMRRTFKKHSRAAEVDAVVQRSIAGHLDPEMDHRYDLASGEEQAAAIAKVISLASFREVAALDAPAKVKRPMSEETRAKLRAAAAKRGRP